MSQIPLSIKEVEPCRCSHGLGAHLTITGRPCEYRRECGCSGYVKALRPATPGRRGGDGR